ncbi:MAG: hypothetical protein IPH05_17550 [Flavobacteriales bacterium]|nr:hypothetical protein [Flavobacteriales bacterium]
MPKDDEMHGSPGTSYDFGARLLDSRTGRWSAVDPLQTAYAAHSPYEFVGSNPIIFIDPDGKKIVPSSASEGGSSSSMIADQYFRYALRIAFSPDLVSAFEMAYNTTSGQYGDFSGTRAEHRYSVADAFQTAISKETNMNTVAIAWGLFEAIMSNREIAFIYYPEDVPNGPANTFVRGDEIVDISGVEYNFHKSLIVDGGWGPSAQQIQSNTGVLFSEFDALVVTSNNNFLMGKGAGHHLAQDGGSQLNGVGSNAIEALNHIVTSNIFQENGLENMKDYQSLYKVVKETANRSTSGSPLMSKKDIKALPGTMRPFRGLSGRDSRPCLLRSSDEHQQAGKPFAKCEDLHIRILRGLRDLLPMPNPFCGQRFLVPSAARYAGHSNDSDRLGRLCGAAGH